MTGSDAVVGQTTPDNAWRLRWSQVWPWAARSDQRLTSGAVRPRFARACRIVDTALDQSMEADAPDGTKLATGTRPGSLPGGRTWRSVLGRRETPLDPKAGPVHRLAWQLRQLREQAGSPSYRVLARRAHYSASTLAEAAKGERLPSLEVTLAYAEACGGDAGEWRARWSATAKAMAASPAPLHAEERCPYQGLTSFQPEQAQWFFGRSELV